jgi:heme exporter protein B
VIYVGKFLGSLILAFGSGFIVLVFFTVLYDVGLNLQWLALLGVMLLTAVGLAAVGTLFSAITVGVRGRGALLTVLVLPLLVPILVAAARCSVVLLGMEPWAGLGLWPVMMVAYDVVFLAVGIALFDYVLE